MVCKENLEIYAPFVNKECYFSAKLNEDDSFGKKPEFYRRKPEKFKKPKLLWWMKLHVHASPYHLCYPRKLYLDANKYQSFEVYVSIESEHPVYGHSEKLYELSKVPALELFQSLIDSDENPYVAKMVPKTVLQDMLYTLWLNGYESDVRDCDFNLKDVTKNPYKLRKVYT